MATEQEYLQLHAQVRAACGQQIVDGVNQLLRQGQPLDRCLIVLAHIDEPILDAEDKAALSQKGLQMSCLAVDRLEFADIIGEFQHPEKHTYCYESVAEAMKEALPANHFYVVVFHSSHASLTKVALVTR